ncbi:MAG: hypothetical protein OXC62_12680 [Aestuariivita sp.]|nr:hypothetical protein [Aestuariivita sp.]
MDASPQKPIYLTKSTHISTIWGIMRTSAQAELVGLHVRAKNRMRGAVRCAILVTNQRSGRKHRKTNDKRLSTHLEPGEDDQCHFLIWIDWLIYVAHMSSCASARTIIMDLRDRQL